MLVIMKIQIALLCLVIGAGWRIYVSVHWPPLAQIMALSEPMLNPRSKLQWIWIEIHTFPFKKINLSPGIWRLFCLGLIKIIFVWQLKAKSSISSPVGYWSGHVSGQVVSLIPGSIFKGNPYFPLDCSNSLSLSFQYKRFFCRST